MTEPAADIGHRRRLAIGGAQILAGQVGYQLLNLLRNLIVARIVSTNDFGIASTFAVTVSLLQMGTDLAWDKLIIQSHDGDNENLQAVVHSMTLLRGLLLSAVILLSGAWLATYFGVPDATLAYCCLAVVPLVRGFDHLDLRRMQRRLNYMPEFKITIASQAISVAVAIWLGFAFHSYWAMLWAMIAQAVSFTVGSHLVAQRPYRFRWASDEVLRVCRFGWPLMANGLIMFVAGQGDRVLIGGSLGMSTLAIYTSATLLTVNLSAVAMKVVVDLFLPFLAQAQSDREMFRTRYVQVGAIVSLVSIALSVPLMFIGADLVRLVFGAAYKEPAALMPFLAATMGIGFLRVWPVTASLALGDTKNMMLVNLARLTGIGIAFVAVHYGASVVAIAASFTVGEIVASFFASARLYRRTGIPLSTSRLLLANAVAIVGSLTLALHVAGGNGIADLAWAFGAGTVCLLIAFVFSRDCRVVLQALASHLRVAIVRRRASSDVPAQLRTGDAGGSNKT